MTVWKESDSGITKRHAQGGVKHAIACASRTKPLPENAESHGLQKCLKIRDAVGFGLGVTVGAGVFMATGKAAQEAGPAVTLAFLVAAVGCSCTGLCYAELAALVPSSGSSYTFVYHSAGELPACLVGLSNIVNSVLSSAAVARGWEGYMCLLLVTMGVSPPQFMEGFAWGPFHVSLLAPLLIAMVVAINLFGTLAISTFNNVVTSVSVTLLMGYIIGGAMQVQTDNWDPYMPTGGLGVTKAAGSVFFSYLGFDVLATLGAEAVNDRVVPCGIVLTLVITTALYCGVGAVFTGLIDYTDVDMSAPLARAAEQRELPILALLISIGAVGNTLTTVIGSVVANPRFCLAMAQDGLLPAALVRVNRFGAPARSLTIMAIPAIFIAALFDFTTIADVVSVGALCTFALVCASLVLLRCPRPAGAAPREDSPNTDEDQGQGDVGKCSSPPEVPRAVVRGLWAFTLFSFLFGVLMRATEGGSEWLQHASIAVAGTGAASAACMIIIPFARGRDGTYVRAEHTIRASQFRVPLMPMLPLVGLFMNVFLASQTEVVTLLEAVVVQLMGAVFYFVYSAPRSHLNRQRKKDWTPVFEGTMPSEPQS